jgi:hypothetical protein
MVKDKGRGLTGSRTGRGQMVLEGTLTSDAIAGEMILDTPTINKEHS